MSVTCGRWISHAALAIVIAWGATAHAQSTADTDAAREHFAAGLAAAHDERWDEAREAFERSLAIMERPSTLLNLAGAQAQTRRVVEAAGSYRRFLELATSGRDARMRTQAETALRAVEARIAHVSVAAAGLMPDDDVRIDDQAVAVDGAVAVDPGAHEIVVMRDDSVVAREPFTVRDGETRVVALEVRVEVVTDRPLDGPDEEALRAARSDEVDGGGEDLTGVWIGVGVGAAILVGVGIGIGVVFGTSGPTYYGGNLGDGMIMF